ncbi:MAG: hypothetical protein NTY88_10280 [Bacteroidetes bacterium]|nr:hypothetical protein [Bacteroidota bacterium]
MNKIFKGFLGVAVLAAMVTVSSCTKTCDKGYEGSDCKTQVRGKLLNSGSTATYNVDNNSCAGSLTTSWHSTIVPASDISSVLLTNVGHLVCGSGTIDLNATIDGTTITIPYQVVCGATMSGTGTVTVSGTTTTISVTYSYNVTGGLSGSCTERWTKI